MRRGYSLVEMMVGSTVLTLVLAGAFSGMGQAFLINEYVEDANFAAMILQSEVEEVHSLQWSQIKNLPAKGTFYPTRYFTKIPLLNVKCTRFVSSLGNLQKEIRLVVSWESAKGHVHDRELVTHYTKNGIYDYNFSSL